MIDYNKLSSMQLDALKEIGNIGAAHAATALSQIIDKTVLINVSRIEIIPIMDIARVVGGPSIETVVARMYIFGDIKGGILLALTKKDSMAFADLLKGAGRGTTMFLSEIDQSALKEAGSILASSYLKATGDFLKLSLIPSVPVLMFSQIKDILDKVLSELTKRSEVAFCIETEFVEAGNAVNGHFLLIPEIGSLEIILKSLGVLDK